MEMSVTAWIIFGIGIGTTLFNIWKSGFAVSKELNKKVDKTEYDKEVARLKSSLDMKLEEDDLKNMRDSIFSDVDGKNNIMQLEFKFLKENLRKHEEDHTVLAGDIKKIEYNMQAMSISMAIIGEQMKAFNSQKTVTQ